MSKAENLSHTAFAKQAKVSRQYIDRLCSSGTLPQNEDGTIPRAEGLKAFKELRQPTGSKSEGMSFNDARARREAATAALKELELQQRRGELIPVSEVRADAAACAANIRDRFFNMPPRIAPLLVGRTAAEMEAMLTDAINEIITAFHDSAYIDSKE
jgi:hypothetical protein